MERNFLFIIPLTLFGPGGPYTPPYIFLLITFYWLIAGSWNLVTSPKNYLPLFWHKRFFNFQYTSSALAIIITGGVYQIFFFLYFNIFLLACFFEVKQHCIKWIYHILVNYYSFPLFLSCHVSIEKFLSYFSIPAKYRVFYVSFVNST